MSNNPEIEMEQPVDVPTADPLQTKLVRLQADFDNFRKRTVRQRGEAADEAKRDVITALLPLYDNFVRALDNAEQHPDLKPFLNGFELMLSQFDQFFKQQGLEEIPAEPGEPFDPTLHEATAMAPPESPEAEGTVAQKFQKGFVHKGSVVRPAQVMVFSAG